MKQMYNRARAASNQAGMTLIEIMIVLAIIAVVMGFLIGPRVLRMFGESKVTEAHMRGSQFVEAYTEWSMNNNAACPDGLNDLVDLMNSKELEDPWGSEYIMVCGDEAPDGVPFGVISKGEDGKKGTSDDIKSWESPKKKKKKKKK